ncbi:MAG: Uncharacterized protein HW387_918 [Parachlamydiales bacterium]|nr:Uncharacterized protein [Parachlamydiales bacterium]
MPIPSDLQNHNVSARPQTPINSFWNNRTVKVAAIVGTIALIAVVTGPLFLPGAPLAMLGTMIESAIGISGLAAKVSIALVILLPSMIAASSNANPLFSLLNKYNPENILAEVRRNGEALEFASKGLRNDPVIVLAAVQQSGWALQYASNALRNNREIVLAAVQQSGWELQYASNALRNNREIVLAAVRQDGWAGRYASDALRSDREIVLAAVQQNGWALEIASDALRNDREIVLAAVQQDGRALRYASDALRNDREIVLAAVQQDGRALEIASDALRNDREIVIAAVQQYGWTLEFASDALRNDREIALAAVRQDGWAGRYASDALKNDREFVLAAVQQYGMALQYASNALRDDREIALAAVRQNARALQYVSEGLRNDLAFSAAANGYGNPAIYEPKPPLRPDEILASPNSLILTSNRLEIHPLVLKKKPEEVLSRLARRSNDESIIPQVVFLQNNLTPARGVDAGGLSAQLITELFEHLFDCSENRKIRLYNNIPSLAEPIQENEKQLLRNLGIVLGRLSNENRLITGRILPDRYYELIQSPLIFTDRLNYIQMFTLCQHLVPLEMKHLHDILQTRTAISPTDRSLLIDQLAFENQSDKQLKTAIEQYLVDIYRSMIFAAREIAQGMTRAIGDLKPLRRLNYTKLSEKIQGQAFSREAIAQRIAYNGHSEVVRQKVTWLKAHITSPDTPQEWVERFLFAITSQHSLTPETQIKILDSSDNACKAHTCFQQLEVPTTHTDIGTIDVAQCPDQQKFLNNLQLLLDIGSDYQTA